MMSGTITRSIVSLIPPSYTRIRQGRTTKPIGAPHALKRAPPVERIGRDGIPGCETMQVLHLQYTIYSTRLLTAHTYSTVSARALERHARVVLSQQAHRLLERQPRGRRFAFARNITSVRVSSTTQQSIHRFICLPFLSFVKILISNTHP